MLCTRTLQHVRDMQKLDAAIQKAEACGAFSPLVTASAAVLARLQAELEVVSLHTCTVHILFNIFLTSTDVCKHRRSVAEL
jgi:hypothetical protein